MKIPRIFRQKPPKPPVDPPLGLRVCDHCGAVWDQNHEQGRCGVREATNRILENYVPREPRRP